ncbi:polysaccharide biosynthesis tyrosine autokinase [Cyclobacterium sp. 1_MG-2023]|uniref:GumC family protein n=1 Tax=Cyclobacterium sp. 1_MG-2023 TaxID=3062681 RepID=UPI0026E1888A|nr:tyrosine-protein kinase family protein [Cyclobacterium sp. 1_MG-2023]MDO6439506.1 polysaccharide biosynthesis tyrosine autokinase [Cyclobacterium sp. 1_MG-2023]
MKKSDILSDLLLDGFIDQDARPMDFKLIILSYLKYWWLFLLSVILFLSLAFAYLFFSTPLYSISSSILIKIDGGSDFTQNTVYSELEAYETNKQVENEMEILASYSLMRDAVEELPLDYFFYTEDKYSRMKELYGANVPVTVKTLLKKPDVGQYPEEVRISVNLFDDHLILIQEDEKKKAYQYGELIENWYGEIKINKSENYQGEMPELLHIYFKNKDQVAGLYKGRIQVNLSQRFASVFNISLVDAVPEKGQDVLNKLIEQYNLQAVKEKNVTASNTIDFINSQLDTLMKELNSIERRIEEYRRSNNISDMGTENSLMVQNSKDIETQLSDIKTQMEVLDYLEEYLRDPASSGIEVASNLSIIDETLTNLVDEFNRLQNERQRLLRTVQPNNPLVTTIEGQLENLKNNIGTNISNMKNGLRIESQNLKFNLDQINSRISNVPEIERGLLELSREQSRKQTQYNYLQSKKEEANLSLATTTVSNARVIDKAASSGSPVKPNKMVILGMALIVGFICPLGIVYIKNALNSKITHKSQVQDITEVPILSEISNYPNGGELLAISEKRRTPIAEQFRLLRTNLKFVSDGKKERVLMITSSISGEGKTFFSLNLGASLSIAKKKVVVLEFDLRKPALLKSVNMKTKLGIADYLSNDDVSIDDIILDFKKVDGLSLIGCGNIPEDPAELTLGDKVEVLINHLKERFDYIIIDTAPVGTVTDAFNLAPYCDRTLFMVRYNFTKKENLIFMEDIDIKNKLRNTSLVMNDAKQTNGYYGYSYGYYPEDKKTAKSSV